MESRIQQKVRRTFRVELEHATFGIISEDNIVIETAPIAHWMRGETLQNIKPYLISKKAKVCELKKQKDLEEKQ